MQHTPSVPVEDLEAVKEFYTFLEFFGLQRFQLAFQRRSKKDGQRGGPFNHEEINSYQELESLLNWGATKNLEAVMRSPGLLLVDDVKSINVEAARNAGSACVAIETSMNNFQLLFVRGEDWTDEQVIAAQRKLRADYSGDFGSIGLRHLHRLPGSVNQKNGGRFITRLHFAQDGELLDAPAVDRSGGRAAAKFGEQKQSNTNGKSPSELDFLDAWAMIRAGRSEQQICAAMLESALFRGTHGDGLDYAKRTTEKAIRLFRPRS